MSQKLSQKRPIFIGRWELDSDISTFYEIEVALIIFLDDFRFGSETIWILRCC